jgi:ATP-dependent RNA helicase DDX10/DBP4
MQPGIPISALHGKIKQERRTLIFMDFARRNSAVLLATDIAARGLDFPDVDWVLQVDAPEDEAMYIHRVGRTARYTSGGRALLLLMPSEEAMVLKKLGDSSVPIKKLTVNPNRAFSVAAKAAALLAAQPEFRVLAKKAFTSYLRSLQMLPSVRRASGNNTGGAAGASSVYEVLNLNQTALDQFAVSLGLGLTPPMPVLDHTSGVDARNKNRKEKNVNR